MKVTEEGAEADLFDVSGNGNNAGAEEKESEGDEDRLVPNVTGNNELAENIARLRMEGYDVDDDNEPAPENVPVANTNNNNNIDNECTYQDWNAGLNVCHRRADGLRFEGPTLRNSEVNNSLYMDWFMYFLPVNYMKNVLLVKTNEVDETNDDITWGELLVYLGLWLLMSTTVSGCDRRSY